MTSPYAVAAHAHAVVVELAELARGARLDTLSSLLEIVALEAQSAAMEVREREQQSRHDASVTPLERFVGPGRPH